MPAKKYLRQRTDSKPGYVDQAGTQVASTPRTDSAGAIAALNDAGVLDPSIVNASVTGGGAAAGMIAQLGPAGTLDPTVMPPGYGQDANVIVAAENLSANDYVNVDVDGVRKADASNDRAASGFVLVAVTSGQPATVLADGTNPGQSGLAKGPVWLSTVPGKATNTKPTAAGTIAQPIGVAVSATAVDFTPGTAVMNT